MIRIYNKSVSIFGPNHSGCSTLAGTLLRRLGDPERNSKTLSDECELADIVRINPLEREQRKRIEVTIGSISLDDSFTGLMSLVSIPASGGSKVCKGFSISNIGILVVDISQLQDLRIMRLFSKTRYGYDINCLLLYSFFGGIFDLIILVNKMDLIGFSKEKFADLRARLVKLVKHVGFSFKPYIIPCTIDTPEADNIFSVSDRDELSWWVCDEYKDSYGSGRCLLDILKRVNRKGLPRRSVYHRKPLRFCIAKVVNDSNAGMLIWGSVIYGTLKVGDEIYISELNFFTVVYSIHFHHKEVKKANPYMVVSLRVFPFHPKIRSGFCIGTPDISPPIPTKRFEAFIIMLSRYRIRAGYEGNMNLTTGHVPVRITTLLERIHKKTMEVLETNPTSLHGGDAGRFVFEVLKPACLETKDSEFPRFSRFFIVNEAERFFLFGRVEKILENEEREVVSKEIGIPFLYSNNDENERRADILLLEVLNDKNIYSEVFEIRLRNSEPLSVQKVFLT